MDSDAEIHRQIMEHDENRAQRDIFQRRLQLHEDWKSGDNTFPLSEVSAPGAAELLERFLQTTARQAVKPPFLAGKSRLNGRVAPWGYWERLGGPATRRRAWRKVSRSRSPDDLAERIWVWEMRRKYGLGGKSDVPLYDMNYLLPDGYVALMTHPEGIRYDDYPNAYISGVNLSGGLREAEMASWIARTCIDYGIKWE